MSLYSSLQIYIYTFYISLKSKLLNDFQHSILLLICYSISLLYIYPVCNLTVSALCLLLNNIRCKGLLTVMLCIIVEEGFCFLRKSRRRVNNSAFIVAMKHLLSYAGQYFLNLPSRRLTKALGFTGDSHVGFQVISGSRPLLDLSAFCEHLTV